MTETITIKQAVAQALKEAQRKQAAGHLYKSSDANDDGEFPNHDWSKGDPETVYSIASLYSQFTDDPAAAEDKIIAALQEEYCN